MDGVCPKRRAGPVTAFVWSPGVTPGVVRPIAGMVGADADRSAVRIRSEGIIGRVLWCDSRDALARVKTFCICSPLTPTRDPTTAAAPTMAKVATGVRRRLRSRGYFEGCALSTSSRISSYAGGRGKSRSLPDTAVKGAESCGTPRSRREAIRVSVGTTSGSARRARSAASGSTSASSGLRGSSMAPDCS
jgi:hypothetical protein